MFLIFHNSVQCSVFEIVECLTRPTSGDKQEKSDSEALISKVTHDTLNVSSNNDGTLSYQAPAVFWHKSQSRSTYPQTETIATDETPSLSELSWNLFLRRKTWRVLGIESDFSDMLELSKYYLNSQCCDMVDTSQHDELELQQASAFKEHGARRLSPIELAREHI